jgi:hypothetical protein
MPQSWIEWLFLYEIRRYQPRRTIWDNWAFWFNLTEAAAWFVIAGLVLARWCRFRRSLEELLYAGLFVAFGLTDVREAFVLQTCLLWVKAINFAGILWVRHRLLKAYYPGWRTY